MLKVGPQECPSASATQISGLPMFLGNKRAKLKDPAPAERGSSSAAAVPACSPLGALSPTLLTACNITSGIHSFPVFSVRTGLLSALAGRSTRRRSITSDHTHEHGSVNTATQWYSLSLFRLENQPTGSDGFHCPRLCGSQVKNGHYSPSRYLVTPTIPAAAASFNMNVKHTISGASPGGPDTWEKYP